jgi:hypothetical protein
VLAGQLQQLQFDGELTLTRLPPSDLGFGLLLCCGEILGQLRRVWWLVGGEACGSGALCRYQSERLSQDRFRYVIDNDRHPIAVPRAWGSLPLCWMPLPAYG